MLNMIENDGREIYKIRILKRWCIKCRGGVFRQLQVSSVVLFTLLSVFCFTVQQAAHFKCDQGKNDI